LYYPSTDFDQATEISGGDVVFVINLITVIQVGYYNLPILAIGTSTIAFTQFAE